ncbi:HNH endonuclease signature motif containing protein [Ralstonia pseudosolanacearum]|uniref:HNH endonuclease signature motif containing protein n=1 Tax=Ralstonia pseudosolanacearum TaxID=1310165 RepID=UPI0022862EBB|nr:HNH endonuclease signature motif containing protein [Ralstonia pseudosolanacearum]MDO3578304.1 HNH endonuclease signature motif containing protein [Ralstonia pseudosolanacearum]MDO3587516.1 HNH endonuclease signature motif containing protein [Ralstonia pseudosolanacearum]
MRAHRVAYELCVAPIPDGMVACHRCDNRACVNPGHIFIATQRENILDMVRKGALLHKSNLKTQVHL